MSATTIRVPRLVVWCNVRNWSQEEGGSLIHQTVSEGRSGVTLCGKRFSEFKGKPAWDRRCRRCELKAARLGLAAPRGFVPSSE